MSVQKLHLESADVAISRLLIVGSPQKGWGSVCAFAAHGQGSEKEGPGGALRAGGVARVPAAQVEQVPVRGMH